MERRNTIFDPMHNLMPIFLILIYIMLLSLLYFGPPGIFYYYLIYPFLILIIIFCAIAIFLSLRNIQKSHPSFRGLTLIIALIVIFLALSFSYFLPFYRYTVISSEPSFQAVIRYFSLFGLLPIVLGGVAFLATYVTTTTRREEDMIRKMNRRYYEDLVEEELKKMK